jgi:hypothetical protein
MSPRALARAAATACLLAALAPPPASSAGGGPYLPLDTTNDGGGVVSADGTRRFVVVETAGETAVLSIATQSGEVRRSLVVPGILGVPSVAFDGSTSGVSADGSRLVLARPRPRGFRPRSTTELRVFDVRDERLRPDPIRRRITLKGDFSFDALSPDGDTLYLVEHPDRRDPTEYQVRALDLATARLDPQPVLDPQEEPGEMRGYPRARATSPDASWQYTLYDGGGDEPFIHALDVVRGRTVCIDLPQLRASEANRGNLSVTADGRSIIVRAGATRARPERTVAIVDTTAGFEVSEPPAPGQAAGGVASAAADGAEGGPPLAPVAGFAAAALLIAALLLTRRLRPRAP